MGRSLTGVALVILGWVAASAPVYADPHQNGQGPGTSNYTPLPPMSRPMPARPAPAGHPSQPGRSSLPATGFVPFYGYPYGIDAYSGWDPYYGYPGYSFYYVPAESIYGPGAMQRFMGTDLGAARPWQPAPARPRAGQAPGEANDDAMTQARRIVALGDRHFANQRDSDALQRYKKAAETAPKLAEAHMRLAYAQVALGHYDQAAKAMKRGLVLDPKWPNSGFTNNELYGSGQLAKLSHIDKLAAAATAHPDNPDLLFLVGVYLYFDGQAERAAPFFQRAVQLGGDGPHLKAFRK